MRLSSVRMCRSRRWRCDVRADARVSSLRGETSPASVKTMTWATCVWFRSAVKGWFMRKCWCGIVLHVVHQSSVTNAVFQNPIDRKAGRSVCSYLCLMKVDAESNFFDDATLCYNKAPSSQQNHAYTEGGALKPLSAFSKNSKCDRQTQSKGESPWPRRIVSS